MIPKTGKTTHPGEILLEEFLIPLNLDTKYLAEHIGVSPKKINNIINKKEKITPKMAWLLSYSFGTSPEFWMNLQMNYDLSSERPKRVSSIR